MTFDYSKLIGKIIEKYGKRSSFAKAMQLSEHSLSMKLNSRISFKQGEILRMCGLLDIAHPEIPDYFFVVKAQAN